MTPISAHFTWDDVTRSGTAARLGIDNAVDPLNLTNAIAAAAMLERCRSFLSGVAGREVPILVSSWNRVPALNLAVGSKPGSDHEKAAAVDWTAPAFGSPFEIARALAEHVDDLGIGQLINEFPDASGWVHTSILRPARSINRIITIKRSGVSVGVMA